MHRRTLLRAGGVLVAGLFLPATAPAFDDRAVEVRLRSDPHGGWVGFDPVGLYVAPGTLVRWVNAANVHTVTAYHPANDNRVLRIPESAEPWDSGYLVEPGATFQRRLTVPGVYDYFCRPHEAAGMVGRIVVGEPSGPGARDYEYFHGRRDWHPVPMAGRRRLPAVDVIMKQRSVPASAGDEDRG